MTSTPVLVLYYAAFILPYVTVLAGVVSLLFPRRDATSPATGTLKHAA